jgi:hypothetical protein
MSSSPEDRATREIEELRRLFAEPVRRVTSEPDQATQAGQSGVDPEQLQVGSPGPADADQDAGTHGSAEEPDGAGLEADATGSGQAPAAAGTSDRSSSSGDPPPSDEPAPRRPTGSVSSRSLVTEPEAQAPGAVPADEAGDPVEQDVPEPPAQRLVLVEPDYPTTRDQPRPRQRAAVAVLAALLLIGAFGLGIWVGQGLAAGREPATSASGVPGTSAPPVQAPASASTRGTAPNACLDTVRLGDQVIAMLVANKRGRELDPVLRAYGTASQQCRAAATR